jgi:predicted Fe-Mo cluster-binding NifX family protein
MKIAISAKGKTAVGTVDPKFGNAAGFVLFDTDTGSADYLDNAAQRELTTAKGIKTAQMLLKEGAQAVITGQIGPKAAQIFHRAGVDIYICTGGPIRSAVESFSKSELPKAGSEDIQPGPGKKGGRGEGGRFSG